MLRLRKVLKYGLPLLAVIYFLSLGWVGLYARFAADDMMNMGVYFRTGWAKLLLAQVQFFSSTYRPFPGLFYMGIFESYGMNPLPYRIGIIAAMTLNTWLAYDVARRLMRSTVAAFLTAALTCYHANQFVLIYNTSQLYDVFCFTFWFGAFLLYIRKRLRGEHLSGLQRAAVLALYICSLNSKEMAVTLPVLMLVFELAYLRSTGLGWDRRDLVRAATPIVLVGLATLAFVAGKTLGSDSLLKVDAYRPVITWKNFLESNAHYVAELAYLKEPQISRQALFALWFVMAYLAWRARRPDLKWGMAMAILGTLPIAFIPGRGGGCLYIPAFGYAMFLAYIADRVARWVSHEPVFRRLRVPATAVRSMILAAALYFYWDHMRWLTRVTLGAWQESQQLTWTMLDQMQKLRPEIKPGAKVLFLNDPFNDWDMYFIAELILRDRTAQITLQRKVDHALSPEEVAKFDTLLTATKDSIQRVR